MCKRAGTHATYSQTLNKIRIASVWVKIGGMAERRETYSKVYQLRPNLQNSLESLGLGNQEFVPPFRRTLLTLKSISSG